MTTITEFEAVLDPVLARWGFAAGQDGGTALPTAEIIGVSLAETMRLCGRQESSIEAASLLNTSAATASVRVAAVLTRLFESVSTPRQRPQA